MTMPATPRRLGRYEILRPLARGGMAELFLARATGIQGFEKLVVVKRILPELLRDTDYVDMFLDEARLAAGLHHSNIVQVYDIGEDGGAPFFAMEYLHGEDVRTIARAVQRQGARVPLEHALSIAIGVAAGLHYAHERVGSDGTPLGIVHRDVSPTNVAVTYDGGVKLLDFGVAKARRRSVETRHGTLKGKLGYMSPEQCRGDELDRRSDVFALAILLWELTVGRRLYGGRSDFGIMKSIVEADAPRPSLVWADCPPELEAIILRGLRRERAARFQTAEELQLALEAFARDRKLAVSGVGLGRWLRELGGARPAPPEGESSTLYDLAPPDEDTADATLVDGLVNPAPATPLGTESAPVRRTRAVARPRRRPPALLLAAATALAVALGGGWGLVRLAHRGADDAVPLPVAARPLAPTPRPTLRALDPPPLDVPPAAPRALAPHALDVPPAAPRAPAPPRDVPPPAARPRPTTRPAAPPPHPSRRAHPTRAAHPHAHAPTPARAPTPTAVDLDAPLPPR